MHELIHTKVAPPAWMGNQIRRDGLLERLDEALRRRLTLVHAPAGYGKTSLLSQWRQRCDTDTTLVAWLTMEQDDSDPNRLAQYIALAIDGPEGAAPGEESDRVFADLPPRAALSAIINRLARETRAVVLILDDLHRTESAPVGEFLKSLIRLAPSNCHFVIASRDYPRLGQSILVAEGQLLEFTVEDLKFSHAEAGALLARAEGDADIGLIVERTEGWPIAVQLTSLSLKPGIDSAQLVERMGGPSSELARYLAEQVLTALPDEVQEIVMRTALLDRLTGDAINLLCDRQDGWLLLERLEQQGVLLSPDTADRRAYRYHQLFAEYLRERLARRDAAQFQALHRRIARWFATRGEVIEAVSHAVQSDDDALLADIIEGFGGWRLIPQGLQAAVERGFAKLPEALVRARPRLMLAQVYLEIKHGRLSAARADYDRFVAEVAEGDLSAEMWSEIRVVGDVLAEYENVPMTLEDLLQREALLRTLSSTDHFVLANFSESLGAKYYEGGWLERALEPTLAAREHYQALGSLYSDLFTRFHEARIKRAQGRMKDAAAILAAARIAIEGNFGARSDLAANCAAFEAELLYESNRREEAAALLDWALPHMEQSDGWVDVYAAAYFTAARIAAGEGDMEEARAILARARRVATRRRLRQLELLAGLCELELLLHHGPVEPARAFAASIDLDALADEMAQDSPVYRPVATAAALCRVRLGLLAGGQDAAPDELRAIRRWAAQHGAGRLLIDLDLLAAFGFHTLGETARAQDCFDEAVGTAMFQDVVLPFVDAGRFVRPVLDELLKGEPAMDRFRAQYLRNLARLLVARPEVSGAPAFLTSAEAVILDHLSHGYSNKEIARLIDMSPDTVKYRLKSVFRKLGVNKRRDAVRIAHERDFGARETQIAAE